MATTTTLVALLLSGGAGQRLWPLSVEDHPKQFLQLFDDRSLFQTTLERMAAAGVDHVGVVANLRHEQHVMTQAKQAATEVAMLLLEPARRDSAAAIAAGVAGVIDRYGSDAVVAVMPCDHLIPDTEAFAAAIQRAVRLAQDDYLVTFGIQPTFPSTDFGYIQRGAAIAGHDNAFAVTRFHEKPQTDKAADYIRSGGFDWNSGIFVFRAGAFVDEARAHMPDIWEAARDSVLAGRPRGDGIALNEAAFLAARRTSIDYALFEKSARVAVLPVSFRWSDVGNWSAVHAEHRLDDSGNALIGDVAAKETSDSLIVADGGIKVAVLGLQDVVVVASSKGVFVAPRKRASEVKSLIGD